MRHNAAGHLAEALAMIKKPIRVSDHETTMDDAGQPRNGCAMECNDGIVLDITKSDTNEVTKSRTDLLPLLFKARLLGQHFASQVAALVARRPWELERPLLRERVFVTQEALRQICTLMCETRSTVLIALHRPARMTFSMCTTAS